MGQNSSNPIRNIDKRTARREYRASFARAIAEWRYERQAGEGGLSSTRQKQGRTAVVFNWGERSTVRVCVRKRPIFKHETDLGEFDTVTALPREVIVHDARMHADMRRMLMNHTAFAFDGVFDEHAGNTDVYESVGRPLVLEAVGGGNATVCVYGQTGSGKTFTMSSFYNQASRDVFDFSNERFAPLPIVSLNFIELHGDTCYDLLNGFASVQLLTAADGSVLPYPVVEPTVESADDLIALINHGVSIRSTAATGVHDRSSRSHALLRIFIQKGGPGDAEGCLTLVDLAGSEQNIDSMYHSAERRREGANINSSLLALKECVRSRAEGQNASFHYRKSKLTMALKHCFTQQSAKTVILACVSPASKDTEHSINTLRHASMMNGDDTTPESTSDEARKEARFVTGGAVDSVLVGEVDVTAITRQNRAAAKSGKEPKDKTSNGNTFGLERGGNVEMTEKEKSKARRMAELNAMKALDPRLRALLEAHRGRLGNEERQFLRQRRPPPIDESVVPAMGRCSPILRPSSREEESQQDMGDQGSAGTFKPHTSEHQALSESKVADRKRLYRKLFKSVYAPSDASDTSTSTSNPMQRRQLVTLMKMNGFTAAEIEAMAPVLDPEVIENEKQSAAQWKSDKEGKPARTFVLNIGTDPGQSSFSTGQPGMRRAPGLGVAGRGSASSPSIVNPSSHASTKDRNPDPTGLALAAKRVFDDAAKKERRRDEARLTREQLETEKRESLLAKISKKKAALIEATKALATGYEFAETQSSISSANMPPPSPPLPTQSTPLLSPPDKERIFGVTEYGSDLERVVHELTMELRSDSLTAVSRHGLQKQLQVAKAKVVRKRRERERERAEESVHTELPKFQLSNLKARMLRRTNQTEEHTVRIASSPTASSEHPAFAMHANPNKRGGPQLSIGAAAAPFGNAMNEDS